MDRYAAYEKLVRQQINVLDELAAREQEKRQALVEARLDLFEKCQDMCDEVFERVNRIEVRRLAAEAELADPPLSPADRKANEKLRVERNAAVERAIHENELNQKLVSEVKDGLGQQRDHIRQGRKAIAGYGQGLKSKKPPSIISGDV